jgi:putative toxin-antitoxin system antitoxin component (TIGR02293 family)
MVRGRRESALDLVDVGARGLPKASLLELARFLKLTTSQVARLLPVTERTIQRYAKSKHFNRAVSERLLEIAQVAARGVEVFGDRDRFLAWLERPSLALGNRAPLELLASQIGTDLVLDELGRIEHGIPS